MTRPLRTEADLRGASDHLHYEFWMLISVAHALASGIAANGWLKNALLESFVIHFRVLIDFFYIETPKKNDVIAADFFVEKDSWEKIRPSMSDDLSRLRERAHKEVAHLTYTRVYVTPEIKGWMIVEITNDIKAIVKLFFQNAPNNLFSERWKGII